MSAVSCPIGPLIQVFFTEHLRHHKAVSPRTISAYRDTFRLLLRFVNDSTGTPPSVLCIDHLDAPTILRFLDHLERDRNNTVRSRNARLAAIRSFFRFVALREPTALAVATRVLAIPAKRTERRLVGYLSRTEMDAILVAPSQTSRSGRRDRALLLTMYNTGARVSEVARLRRCDVTLDTSPHVHLQGKGRKHRAIPIWPRTARTLRLWFNEMVTEPTSPAFPNARTGHLSRHGVAFILRKASESARAACPSLDQKRVSPHTIRHTTAMHLLQSGVDPAVIALWLGHESLETTHIYVEADLEMKRQALGKIAPAGKAARPFKPDDPLLAFLKAL